MFPGRIPYDGGMKSARDRIVGKISEDEQELSPTLLPGATPSNTASARRALKARATRKARISEITSSVGQDLEGRVIHEQRGSERVAPPRGDAGLEALTAQPSSQQETAEPASETQVEQEVDRDAPRQVAPPQEQAQDHEDEQRAQHEEAEVVDQEESQSLEVVSLGQDGGQQAPSGGAELAPEQAVVQAEARAVSELDLAWAGYRDAYLAYKAACAKKDELRAAMHVKKLKRVEKRANARLRHLRKHPTHDDGRFATDARQALALVERARTQKELARDNLQSAHAQLKLVLGRVASEVRADRRALTREQALADEQIRHLKFVASALAKQLASFSPENIESGGARLRELSDEVDALRMHIAAASETLDLKSTRVANAQIAQQRVGEVQRNFGRMQRLDKHVAITEVSFAGLLKMISPMLGGDTGSMTLGLSVGVTGGVASGQIATAGATLALQYSGSMSIQDDRKLRVSHKLGLSGSLEAALGPAGKAGVSGELFASTTEVFLDERHWAAHLSHRIGKAFAAVASGLRGNKAFHKKVRQEDIEFARSMGVNGSMMEILHLNQKRPGKVIAGGSGVGASVNALSLAGVSGNAGAQAQHFTDEKGRTKTGTVLSAGGSVSVGPFSISVAYSDVQGNANPDNDGRYRNVALSVAGGLLAQLKPGQEAEVPQVLQDVGAFLDSSSLPQSEEDLPAFLQSLQDLLGSFDIAREFATSLPFALDVGVNGSLGREWNYAKVGDHGYQRQYARDVNTLSAKIAASIPTNVPGLSVSLGANVGRTKASHERLGTHTISYLMTVYNGLSARDRFYSSAGVSGEQAQQWQRYAEAHRPEIQAICRNIAAGDAVLRSELSAAGADLVHELESLCADSFADRADDRISGTDFTRAVALLGQVFDDLTRQNKEAQDWKAPKEKQTSQVGHLTVRMLQGPWVNIDALEGGSDALPGVDWWQLGTMIDPELLADQRARTSAWNSEGVGARARDIRALLDKGFLITLVVPQVGRVSLTAATREAALRQALAEPVTQRLQSTAPELASNDQQRDRVIEAIIAAILDADVGFEVPRPLLS